MRRYLRKRFDYQNKTNLIIVIIAFIALLMAVDIIKLNSLFSLVIALAIAISVHECAHAWTACKLGDPTAKNLGRLTLNPIKHLDVMGTLLIFLVHFGWGKPVPVNPHNLKHPARDQALISIAGPLANFITAAILALPVKYFSEFIPLYILSIILFTIELNIILMVFNLIPIPPLDGSRVLYAFLPARSWQFQEKFDRYGPFILLAIILLGSSGPHSILGAYLGTARDAVKALIFFQS